MVVVDELGKMELASAAFSEAVTELLGRDVAVVATVHLGHHRFTDALKRRPDVQVIRITEDIRDALPSQLLDRLVDGPRGGGAVTGASASSLEAAARAKEAVRERIWALMEREQVACFPGATGRIPNFAGDWRPPPA